MRRADVDAKMTFAPTRLVLPIAAVAASLVAAGGYIAAEANANTLLATLPRFAEAPPELGEDKATTAARAGAVVPTPARLRQLATAVTREPLNQRLFNLVYVQKTRIDAGRGAASAPSAALLSSLGWRYTPAQQNLILRSALAADFPAIVDRVDALLRRQRVEALGFQLMGEVEKEPSVRHLVVARLKRGVSWRLPYLLGGAQVTGPALQTARIATTRALLASGAVLRREEVSPFLGQLVQSDRAVDAYALWLRYTGAERRDNLLYDPAFAHARRLGSRPALPDPFEWQFQSGSGYSTILAGDGGAVISWDGRGVPILLTQRVPVAPGRAYALEVTSRAPRTIAETLTFSLICGTGETRFEPVAVSGKTFRLRATLPRARCRIAQFTIAGALRDRRVAVDAQISRMRLVPAG